MDLALQHTLRRNSFCLRRASTTLKCKLLSSKIPRTDFKIIAAEKLLLNWLDTTSWLEGVSCKKLTIELLKKFLEEKNAECQKNSMLHELLSSACFEAFGMRVNEISEEDIRKHGSESVISLLATFQNLICPCMKNPKLKSCVDSVNYQTQDECNSI